MCAVESVEGFSINLAFALDFKGNVKTLPFANNWKFPSNFNSIFGFVCCHINICTLFSTSASDMPIFDLKVGRNNILDEDILQCSISVILKENENFVTTLSTHRYCLLSSREISSQVANTNRWYIRYVSKTYWSKLFRTELESSRCIDSLICRCWVRCIEFVLDNHTLAWLEANRTLCTYSERHCVSITIW